MQYWKAHYKDDKHDADIIITNTEEDYKYYPLFFELDGIKFHGTSLGDFELADEMQYDEAKQKFNILKWGGMNSKINYESCYVYTLQRYRLDIDIPIIVVCKEDKKEINAQLHMEFEYVEGEKNKCRIRCVCDDAEVYWDKDVVYDFSVHIGNEVYTSDKKTLYFEAALNDICRKMREKYYLKTCYTCQYSDYSPYGNDDYGIMLCYKRYKEECLKVNDKDEYFKYLSEKDCDCRQETYLCEEYTERNISSGYRGFVDGAFETK